MTAGRVRSIQHCRQGIALDTPTMACRPRFKPEASMLRAP
ncbi:MAG: hypothetical protein RLZZ444_2678 [Pseudomonadota bacterium]